MYFDIITNKTSTIPVVLDRYLFKHPEVKPPFRVHINDEQKIKKTFLQINKKLSKLGLNKLICLDFHGVADLYGVNEKLPGSDAKIIISYIGGNPKTVGSTTNSIVQRILSKEIIFGIIVYLKKPEPICGTKGWILNHLIQSNPGLKLYFIDDGMTNIECVNKLSNPNIKTYFHNSKASNSKNVLTELLGKI